MICIILFADAQMERVRGKADQCRHARECVELCDVSVLVAGEPSPFRAYIPQEEAVRYRRDQRTGATGRMIYKVRLFSN